MSTTARKKRDVSQQRKNAWTSVMWNTTSSCNKCINHWNYKWTSAVQKDGSNNFPDSHFCVQSLYYKVWEGQIVQNYLVGWNLWLWSQQKIFPCCQFWEFEYVCYIYLSALAVGKIQMDTKSLSWWMEDKMSPEKMTLGFMNLRKRNFLFHIFASIAKYNSWIKVSYHLPCRIS